MSIRPGYSQLYYDVEKSDTLYYFSINTDNRFDNPIYFAIDMERVLQFYL